MSWWSSPLPPTDKNGGCYKASSIILGPFFFILSHVGSNCQRGDGILFDRPLQMLNDDDTKREPTVLVLTEMFSMREDFTGFKKDQPRIKLQLCFWQVFGQHLMFAIYFFFFHTHLNVRLYHELQGFVRFNIYFVNTYRALFFFGLATFVCSHLVSIKVVNDFMCWSFFLCQTKVLHTCLNNLISYLMKPKGCKWSIWVVITQR